MRKPSELPLETRKPAAPRGRSALLAATAALALAGALGAAPARADHDDAIYCDVHHAYYEPAHYRRHVKGYVVLSGGGYHFYPRPGYATLVAGYAGQPAVFVSGGHFYPLWVGYGPVYEPTGYFEIYGGKFGRTHLGLRVGINALPTVGFGFLAYAATVVHYQPYPPWVYYRAHAGPPHLHFHGHPARGHGRHPHHPHVGKFWKFD